MRRIQHRQRAGANENIPVTKMPATPARNKNAIADQTAQPWRGEPVMRPNV